VQTQRKSVPSYRKHRASGQAVVTLNGRDFYLGLYGSKASRIEYDRLVGEWLQQGRQIQFSCKSLELSVVELIAAYMQFAARYYRKGNRLSSEYHASRCALRPVKLLYGRKPCSEFGPIALAVVMQNMIDAELSRGTVNQNAGRIKRIFKWGVSHELIAAGIYQGLASVVGLRRGRTEARETMPVRPVADWTIEATLPHLPIVMGDMVRLQRYTGMRPNAVCQLRPVDIDRTADVWVYRPEFHKTQHHGKERVIYIGPQAQAVLLRYLARDAQAHCFRPCDSEAKWRAMRHAARNAPLSCGNFPDSNRKKNPKRTAGNACNVDGYRRAISRACQIAKVEQWAPNQLRHAAATLVRQQFGLEAAQILLGHAKADITQIYAERDQRKVSKLRGRSFKFQIAGRTE
jgi:integrase